MKTNYLTKKSDKGSKSDNNLGCLCNAGKQTRQESAKNILLEVFNDLQNMVAKKPKEPMKVICGHRCKCKCGCRNSCQEKEFNEKKKGCLTSRAQDKLKDSFKDHPHLADICLSSTTRQNHNTASKRLSKTCHQKKQRSSFEDDVKKFGPSDICCPNVLKFIVEDLYKDIKAMKATIDYGLYGRKESARRGVSDSCIGLIKKCQTSFPVSICSVRPVGSRAIRISWVVHSFCGLVGYEIWVDNCCKTRLHTTSYNSTCAYEVDVTKNHIIVLYPLVTENCIQEVITSGVKSSICKRDLCAPKGPLLPISWTPSVYVYIPFRSSEDE